MKARSWKQLEGGQASAKTTAEETGADNCPPIFTCVGVRIDFPSGRTCTRVHRISWRMSNAAVTYNDRDILHTECTPATDQQKCGLPYAIRSRPRHLPKTWKQSSRPQILQCCRAFPPTKPGRHPHGPVRWQNSHQRKGDCHSRPVSWTVRNEKDRRLKARGLHGTQTARTSSAPSDHRTPSKSTAHQEQAEALHGTSCTKG